MRRLCAFLATGALLLGISGSASAGSFSDGTLALSIGSLPPITVSSSPATFSVTAGGALNEPAGVFGPTNIALPRALFTGVPSISGLTLQGFGNGTVAGTLPAASGGLQGSSLVNVLGLLNLSIPLTVVGSPGASIMAGAGGIAITVFGQGWTTGMAVVTGVTTETPGTMNVNTATRTGAVTGPLSGNATVTLVSAFKVITNVAGNLPGLAIQTLRFAPEPGGVAALMTAVAAVGFLGLRARRRGR